MVERNFCMKNLPASYLFHRIAERRKEFALHNPGKPIISLGIGNTTEPLPSNIAQAMAAAAAALGTREGYSGYGDEQGMTSLREKIASVLYGDLAVASDVFVSDGAKCDIARLQAMFGARVKVAVQNPSYPVYVDGSAIIGAAGDYDGATSCFKNILYLDCVPENNFFPDLEGARQADVIYFCSPNNPTGAVASRNQLQELVEFARNNSSIIVFDAAYSSFITEQGVPRSIYEIDGAEEVAIEVSSFSKLFGFTGVRLGWTVVPSALKYSGGASVREDWQRIVTTLFNGASNIAQQGGLAALDPEGAAAMHSLAGYYLENARLIREGLQSIGVQAFGGINAPYVWAKFVGKSSWQAFDELLEKAQVITTPGSGFGSAGEGFLRFSSFGSRANVEEAVARLKQNF